MSEGPSEHTPNLGPQGAAIAGFWRRLGAFAVDGLIVGVPLILLGHVFFAWASGLGEAGRLIGFLWALAYFGTLNSALGGGQTFGKRLLGVQVVDGSGHPIPLPYSLVRFTVLGGPWCLNGIWVDVDIRNIGLAEIFGGVLLVMIVFGGLGALVYLYIFNRQSRQSLHDLAVGSFVVRREARARPVQQSTPRLHRIAVAGWFGVCLVMSGVTVYVVKSSDAGAALAEIEPLRHDLKRDFGALSVKIQMGRHTAGSGEGAQTTTVVQVTMQVPETGENLVTMASDVALMVLRRHPDLLGRQVLAVRIVRGFNFGFASWSKSGSAVLPLAAWRKRLGV